MDRTSPDPSDPSGGAELAPADELAEILADLSAWVEWQRMLGAHALPREPSRDPASDTADAAPRQSAPRQSAPRQSAPRQSPQRKRPPSAPAAPPRSAQPSPSRARKPPASTASGGRAAGTVARPAEPPTRADKVELGEAWARFARPGGLVSSGSQPSGELQQALQLALKQDDPGARLQGIREVMGDCKRCELCQRRRQIVFGVGSPRARLVILGEGPGEQEDLQGEPFVGRAGQMLDRMIENVLGLSRSQVYILNMVKCRPPRNRNPQPDELDACRPFLDAQLSAIQPDLVLVLGSVATRALLGQGVTRARGRWTQLDWNGGAARCMATFHPAYLLRKPQDKRLTFADLKQLRAALDELPRR